MKKISIILPVYNAGKYLERCIDSLLAQSYGNFEIIAVDDGSTDDSPDILKKYSEDDPRIVLHELMHGNVSVARNFAIRKMTGTYVTFIDADDWCERDYLIELMSLLEQSGSNLSVCGCSEISDKGIVERYLEDFEPALLKKEDSSDILMAFLSENNVLSACWSKMYRTEIIRDKGILFSEEAIVNSDIIFNMEYLLYCNHVSFVRMPLYNYVKYSSSLSSRRDPDAARTIDKVINGKMSVLRKSRLDQGLIESTILHWRFRTLAFSCFREMTSTDRIPLRERTQKSLELAGMVKMMLGSGGIDKNRIKARTMHFILFLNLVNKVTLPVMLVPVHIYSHLKRRG